MNSTSGLLALVLGIQLSIYWHTSVRYTLRRSILYNYHLIIVCRRTATYVKLHAPKMERALMPQSFDIINHIASLNFAGGPEFHAIYTRVS
jgi:hypothetical protein